MIKKELFIKILFGFVIAYLATLLVFVTCKHVFSLDANNLSALGSMFSAGATFFAAFVAYWLFNDWRVAQTGINRSELAKNTLLSFYELITLCEYYSQQASAYVSLESAKKDPKISLEFIKKYESIPEVCKKLNEEFKGEYRLLRRKFEINLRTYEKIFDVEIVNVDVSLEFDNYSFAIAGVLRDLSLSKAIEEIKNLEYFMQTSKKAFQTRFQNEIVAETSKHINIKGHIK